MSTESTPPDDPATDPPTATTTTGTASSTDGESNRSTPMPTPITRRSLWARLLGLVGLGIVGAGFWLAAGELGVVVAAVIGFAWYFLSGAYAVAIGHAAFLPIGLRTAVLAPTEAPAALAVPVPVILVAETGLILLLLAPAIDTGAPGRFLGAFLVALGGIGGLAAGAYWWSDRLWIGGAVLVGVVGLAGYGLHRYELVRLGLVRTDGEHTNTSTAAGEST